MHRGQTPETFAARTNPLNLCIEDEPFKPMHRGQTL